MLKPRGFLEHQASSSGGVVSGNLRATRTLIALAVVAGVLVLAIIGWPLVATGRPPLPPTVFWAAFAYFAIIGLAFMLIQIAFLQRFSVYLGHPTYTFSIILFLMILSAGLGSLASERIDLERHRQIVWLPVGIAAAVFVETMLLQPVVDVTVGWGLPGRILVVTAFRRTFGLRVGLLFSPRSAPPRPTFRSRQRVDVGGERRLRRHGLDSRRHGIDVAGHPLQSLRRRGIVCPACGSVPAPRGGTVVACSARRSFGRQSARRSTLNV